MLKPYGFRDSLLSFYSILDPLNCLQWFLEVRNVHASGPWLSRSVVIILLMFTNFSKTAKNSFHCIAPKSNIFIFGPRREKTCLRRVANNKGADQPAHPRSLISAFVFRFLESIPLKLATIEISTF